MCELEHCSEQHWSILERALSDDLPPPKKMAPKCHLKRCLRGSWRIRLGREVYVHMATLILFPVPGRNLLHQTFLTKIYAVNLMVSCSLLVFMQKIDKMLQPELLFLDQISINQFRLTALSHPYPGTGGAYSATRPFSYI